MRAGGAPKSGMPSSRGAAALAATIAFVVAGAIWLPDVSPFSNRLPPASPISPALGQRCNLAMKTPEVRFGAR